MVKTHRPFTAETAVQFCIGSPWNDAADTVTSDNQEVKIIVCNTMYVGSNPTRFL